MNENKQISKIMTSPVVTLEVSHSLQEAGDLMRKNKIRHLPIIENKELIGILSWTDLSRLSFNENFGDNELDADVAVYEMLSVRQVMMSKPITLNAQQTIREAAKVFAENEFHALPIVEENQLVGIISTTDLITYFLKYCK